MGGTSGDQSRLMLALRPPPSPERLDNAAPFCSFVPRLTRGWSVGNYALGLAFSDGHDTGIYTFKALRGLADTEMEDV